MATPLHLSTERRDDGTTVLRAVGELDLSNTATLADALTAALSRRADGTPLLVDMARVGYLDSGAINVLYDHADSIELIVNPVLLGVLKISGLTEVATVTAAAPD
jgi:anti-anti-sigma factor